MKWHADQLTAEIDGQMVVMGLLQGKYVGFDGVASEIWRRLERPQTVSELCDGLVRDFDGDGAVIAQDTIDLISRLREYGLIDIEAGGAE
ncbi:MAG: PqqD family protein [Rhizomicrobium sp.]